MDHDARRRGYDPLQSRDDRETLVGGLAARLSRARAVAAAIAFVASPGAVARAATLPAAPLPTAVFDEGALHVETFGRGDPPLVLVPGLASGTWAWYGTIAHFSVDHTVYALTLPGCAGRPAVAPPLFPRFASDFWTLLERRHVVAPVVIGHGLGGMLAIALGEQHPERLRAVIALDGLPVFPGTEHVAGAERAAPAERLTAPIASGTHDALLAYEQRAMRTSAGVLDATLADALALRASASDPAATAAYLREELANDLRPGLAKVTVPLLEISPYAPEDFATPPDALSEEQERAYDASLLTGAPHVRVVSVSPARHFAMYDAPEAFYRLVADFIAGD